MHNPGNQLFKDVAFVAYPVKDVKAARAFYEGPLGSIRLARLPRVHDPGSGWERDHSPREEVISSARKAGKCRSAGTAAKGRVAAVFIMGLWRGRLAHGFGRRPADRRLEGAGTPQELAGETPSLRQSENCYAWTERDCE
ncbi:MAG TPA: hypothetical protein VJA21_28810 [Verrucomicrobiae bacterium]